MIDRMAVVFEEVESVVISLLEDEPVLDQLSRIE